MSNWCFARTIVSFRKIRNNFVFLSDKKKKQPQKKERRKEARASHQGEALEATATARCKKQLQGLH